jgi:hypothetical protein
MTRKIRSACAIIRQRLLLSLCSVWNPRSGPRRHFSDHFFHRDLQNPVRFQFTTADIIASMSGYTTPLCGCLSDPGIALKVCLCGWTLIPSGQNWAVARRDKCGCCHCCMQGLPVWTRTDIRKQRGASGTHFCGDCCVYACCFECATCQDARELKALGEEDPAGYTTPGSAPGSYVPPPAGFGGPPPPAYGAPNSGPGYGAPLPGYQHPGYPPPPGYGAPPPQQPGYGALPPQGYPPQPGYAPPQGYPPPPGYQGPSDGGYVAPGSAYMAAPDGGYAPPQ